MVVDIRFLESLMGSYEVRVLVYTHVKKMSWKGFKVVIKVLSALCIFVKRVACM